jgi:hypothetical protein
MPESVVRQDESKLMNDERVESPNGNPFEQAGRGCHRNRMMKCVVSIRPGRWDSE